MAFVVTDNCILCKYTDCVEVCPVNCFFQEDELLVIHPEVCIDCEACVPECPVDAIMTDTDADQKWIDRNANGDFSEDKRVSEKGRFSKSFILHWPVNPNLFNSKIVNLKLKNHKT